MNINSEYRKELNAQDLEEIGHIGNWKVSSAKPGHGVDKLRDNRLDTYWQYAIFLIITTYLHILF